MLLILFRVVYEEGDRRVDRIDRRGYNMEAAVSEVMEGYETPR